MAFLCACLGLLSWLNRQQAVRSKQPAARWCGASALLLLLDLEMSSKILIFLAKNQNLSAQILRQKRVPLSWILEKVLLWSMMLRMTVVLNLGSTPIHCYPVFLQRLFFCDFTICMYNGEKSSLEYPYNKIGMVLHLWEPKGTFLTKFYKTGYDLWIKSSWLSTSNDPLITELVEIMDCENILQAGIELGVYFDHISGLCSNFDLGLWPPEAFYRPYYITDINRLVQ